MTPINAKAFTSVIELPGLDGNAEILAEPFRFSVGQSVEQRGSVAMRRGLVWLIREAMISEALSNSEKLMVARTLGNGDLQRDPKRGAGQLDALSTEWKSRNSAVAELFAFASDAFAAAVPTLELMDETQQSEVA